MLKIVRGDTVLSVTNGAYNEFFKKQGYELFEDKEPSTPNKASGSPVVGVENTSQDEYEEDEVTQDEYEEESEGLTDEDLLETPVSAIATMDIEDLRRLAILKGIDIDAYKTKKELRAQVKKVM